MKYTFYTILLTTLFFSAPSFSQEFDEAFLKSLPDDISEDLLQRSSDKMALEETQYRRPSTFIEKPDPTSNRYGAKIFSMMQSTLMPTNEPNFDSSYILDFGDQMQLQTIGQKSSITTLSIKRDGSVNIDDIGKLYISGLSLKEASNLIKDKINESFIGVKSYITLTNIRDIQILMTGNVYNPGSYTLNGNSNLFHALSVSGGPSENGSFRKIDLVRDNKVIHTADLYQTFIFGKATFNNRLQSGDIIFVHPVQNIIDVNGAVMRTGVYELKDDENLSQALIFTNGLNAYADLQNITLNRVLDGRITKIPISNISQFENIKSKNGDSISIREHSFRQVEISGAVLNPGTYLMNEGDNLLDIISKSGGLSDLAYPFGAVYINQETRNINETALEKLYKDSVENIAQLIKETGSQSDYAPLLSLISDLKLSEVSGRQVVDIIDGQDNTMLKDGDSIMIPELSNQVYLFGSLNSFGTASYVSGKGLDYYIDKKGGLSDNANKNEIYILQPNGETFKLKLNKNIFTSKKSKEAIIYPGSVIYIPEEVSGGYSTRLKAQAYATIIGNMGVTLASLAVLKD